MDPDQAQQNVWVQTVWHIDGIGFLKEYFPKTNFEEKKNRQQKSLENYLVGEELIAKFKYFSMSK